MPTLCLLEVTTLAQKRSTANERYFQQKNKKKLETKAMTTSSQCNTGKTCLPFPIITRENHSLAIHIVPKITIIRAQKIGKFAV